MKILNGTALDHNNQSPMYVAVIDDEVDLVYLFKDALSQIEGVEVFGFCDPNLALEHFQIDHQNYKVIISDYRMPGMTGIQLFEKMKEIDSTVTRMLISAFEIQDKVFQDLKVGKSKGLCLYHKLDFETMFSEDDSDKLKEYHKERVILVN